MARGAITLGVRLTPTPAYPGNTNIFRETKKGSI